MEAEHVSKEPPEPGKAPHLSPGPAAPGHGYCRMESQQFVAYLPAPVSSTLDRVLRWSRALCQLGRLSLPFPS